MMIIMMTIMMTIIIIIITIIIVVMKGGIRAFLQRQSKLINSQKKSKFPEL